MLSKNVLVLGLLLATPLASLGCGAKGKDARNDEIVRQASDKLAIDSDTLWRPQWTGLTRIPVCFTNGTTAQRNNVRSVAEGSWEAIGATIEGNFGRYGVDYTGWGTCPASTTETIRITFNTGGPNVVEGGLGRTMDLMRLSTGASNATIMHEFGHALGFTHEFLRSDYDAVDPDCTAEGGTVPNLGISGPDTASIMNYTQCGRDGNLTLADVLSFASLYGPWEIAIGSKLAIRHSDTWNFVRADSTPDVSSPNILASREFTLERVSGSGSGLQFGDAVRLRTNDGTYLRSNGSGNYVTTTTSTASASTWRIYGRIVEGPVRVNDELVIMNSDSSSLQGDSANRLVTGNGDFFRFVSIGGAINL
jgi:hypothetical protein